MSFQLEIVLNVLNIFIFKIFFVSLMMWKVSSGVEPLLTRTLLITTPQNQAYFGPRPDEAPQVAVET